MLPLEIRDSHFMYFRKWMQCNINDIFVFSVLIAAWSALGPRKKISSLPSFRICCRELGGSNLRVFAHARAVSAPSVSPKFHFRQTFQKTFLFFECLIDNAAFVWSPLPILSDSHRIINMQQRETW